MVTVSIENVVRQVDDSLLWQQTIAASFNHTAEYLTLEWDPTEPGEIPVLS
jgi:hypothetical protein